MDRRQYLHVAGGSVLVSSAGCSSLSSPAAVELASIDAGAEEVPAGTPLEVSATVRNDGGRAGEADLRIRLGDGALHEERVSVDPEGTEQVTTEIDTSDVTPGERELRVRVGERERTAPVTVLEPAAFDVELTPRSVETDHRETADVVAIVENAGGSEGTTEVTVLVDGEDVAGGQLTVPAEARREVSLSVETEGYDPGEYDLAIRVGDAEATGTLEIRDPRPDPTVVDVGMADPSVEGLDQRGRQFTATIENGGDPAMVGYALVFFESEDQHVWHDAATVEGVGSTDFGPGQRREVTLSESTSSGGYYGFRVWPAEVRAEVRNDGPVGGTVFVELRNGESRHDVTEVSIEAGASTTVTFEPNFAYTRPRGLSVDVSAPE